MALITIGTVQLGIPYGISGKQQPSEREALELLATALSFRRAMRDSSPHTVFDTAKAYGSAERLLGILSEHTDVPQEITVSSKFLPHSFEGLGARDVLCSMERQLSETKRTLGNCVLRTMMLHSETDVTSRTVIEALREMKASHPELSFGASLYDVDLARRALEIDEIDCLQVPASILDQRMLDAGIFNDAVTCKKTISVRSVFLQGLLTMPLPSVPQSMKHAISVLSKAQDVFSRFALRPQNSAEIALKEKARMCIAYASQLPGSPTLVLGCRTREQVLENYEAAAHTDEYEGLFAAANEELEADESIVIPSLWKEARP